LEEGGKYGLGEGRKRDGRDQRYRVLESHLVGAVNVIKKKKQQSATGENFYPVRERFN